MLINRLRPLPLHTQVDRVNVVTRPEASRDKSHDALAGSSPPCAVNVYLLPQSVSPCGSCIGWPSHAEEKAGTKDGTVRAGGKPFVRRNMSRLLLS